MPEPNERKPLPGLLEDITSGKKVDVTDMPACLKLEISRIPSPLSFQRESKKENIDLDYVSVVLCRELVLPNVKKAHFDELQPNTSFINGPIATSNICQMCIFA